MTKKYSVPPAIKTSNLSKNFGRLKAVKKVDLEIKAGQIFSLIGPNGSGKTSLLKLLVGLHSPTSGKALINGYNINLQPIHAKTHLGYVPDNPSGFDYLTGFELLRLTARIRKLRPPEIDARITELIEIFDLKPLIHQRLEHYSRGNRQKLSFLTALISQPKVLIIDEPIVGLDPQSIKIFGDTLRDFAHTGGAVLFATHILEFGQQHATHVGVMFHGEIIKQTQVRKGTSFKALYKHLTQPNQH